MSLEGTKAHLLRGLSHFLQGHPLQGHPTVYSPGYSTFFQGHYAFSKGIQPCTGTSHLFFPGYFHMFQGHLTFPKGILPSAKTPTFSRGIHLFQGQATFFRDILTLSGTYHLFQGHATFSRELSSHVISAPRLFQGHPTFSGALGLNADTRGGGLDNPFPPKKFGQTRPRVYFQSVRYTRHSRRHGDCAHYRRTQSYTESKSKSGTLYISSDDIWVSVHCSRLFGSAIFVLENVFGAV